MMIVGFIGGGRIETTLLVAHGVDDLDQWQEEREHNRTDDERQEYDHDWLQDTGKRGYGIVNFVIVNVGDFRSISGN